MIWDYQFASEIGVGNAEAEKFLDECMRAGWEPFAVSKDRTGHTIHLRHGLVLA